MSKTFAKGFFMGVCDTIPGVSGGTIAFITGIYHRLIDSVKNIFSFHSLNSIRYGIRGEKSKFKSNFKKIDFFFLITVFLGIILGVLISSRVVKLLLDSYYVFIISFFAGLIFASCFVIFREIKNHTFNNLIFLVIGIFAGFLFSILSPVSVVSPGNYYLFFGGFLGASAMFLPGISGAFIIFVMGIYEFVIDALNNVSGNIYPLTIFFIGILFGIAIISRCVSYLFKKDKCKTLYFLLGLVFGSLSLPFGEIILNVVYDGVPLFPRISLLFFSGVLIVLLGQYLEKKSKEKFIEVPN